MNITSAHGGGGELTQELIRSIFLKHYGNEILEQMEDAAVLSLPSDRIAFTTDSFVVSPLFFPGGDIGKLAVCGTVNDLLMRGATPLYLSVGFILQEGLAVETLDRIVASMKKAADEANIKIVTGDTKVIEGDGGLFINTSGIGILQTAQKISAQNAKPGDAVLINGELGDHHACILSGRLGFENEIRSDCAPLSRMVEKLLESKLPLHTLRDVTRGGLATVLHEIALSSGVQITVDDAVPLASPAVQGFCEILGLDPLYMANEGKMVLILPSDAAEEAVSVLRTCPYGAGARIIGEVTQTDAPCAALKTRSGGVKRLSPLFGEGLPRIC